MSAIVDLRSSLSDLTQRIAAAERRLIHQRAHVGRLEREGHDGSDANALLEFETLEGSQVEEIVRTGKFTAPPKPPTDVGPAMGAPAGTPLPESPPKPAPPTLPGLGTHSPAPAG